MRVQLSLKARENLRNIVKYISQKLNNPIAAKNTIRKIRNTYLKLCDNPYIGTPLDTKTSFKSDYRFMVCGTYIIIYYIEGSCIMVTDICSGMQKDWYLIFK